VLASEVQGDAVICSKRRPIRTSGKGHKPLSVTSSVEDRLESKGRSRTCKLRVKVWKKVIELPSYWRGK